MKNFLGLALLGLVPTLAAIAQDNPGWLQIAPLSSEDIAERVSAMIPFPGGSTVTPDPSQQGVIPRASSSLAVQSQSSLTTPTPVAGGNEADTITPEISALARGLRFDVVKIYEYVRNHIVFEPYYGCKKGAHLTLMEGSGNDFDQSALLMALLRASGKNPSYKYDARYFTYAYMVVWMGLPVTPFGHLTDAQFSAAYNGLVATPLNRQLAVGSALLDKWGYYYTQAFHDNSGAVFAIPHVSVELSIDGTLITMMPAYKAHEEFAGINLAAATGYLKTDVITDAGGAVTSSPDSVTSLSYPNITARLETYSLSLTNHLKNNLHKLDADMVTGKRVVKQRTFTVASQFDRGAGWIDCPWLPVQRWSAIPVEQMSKLQIQCGTYDYAAAIPSFTTTLFSQTINMPALRGRKLSLSWSGNTASIHLDESLVGAVFTTAGVKVDLQMKCTHHFYKKKLAGGVYTDGNFGRGNQTTTNAFLKGDSYAYAFPYSFTNPDKICRLRQEVLDGYRRAGLTDSDWRVRTEVLNIMGLQWYAQTWRAQQVISPLYDTIPLWHHRFGRVAQEQSYYIDVSLQLATDNNEDSTQGADFIQLSSLMFSAMEHGVIEQMQGEDRSAASTVKVIALANQQGVPIFRANASNWPAVRGQLINYRGAAIAAGQFLTGVQYQIVSAGTTNFTLIGSASNDVGTFFIATGSGTGSGTAAPSGLTEMEKDITQSVYPGNALLPKNGQITINHWKGSGYAFASSNVSKMLISGGYFGGYQSDRIAAVSSDELATWINSDPAYNTSRGTTQNVPFVPVTTPEQRSNDPVEMLSGAFVLDKTELTLGSGAAPRGITFSRHYNSHRRYDKSSGIGYGWTHNYDIHATKRSSVTAGLAGSISYHSTPFIAAIYVAADLHKNHTTAKEWTTAALVINWAVDQLKYNAVAITMGNRTIEFVRMPDGTYEAPAGMNLTLASHGSGASEYFTLTERHGSTYTFDTAGRITTITDLWNQSQTFTYTAGLLTGVSDSYARTLTFTRPAGRITSVADSAGRSISFGYTGDDLTSCTDVEGKTWSYLYDTEHQLTHTKDPSARVIVQNIYDSLGRVAEQFTFGQIDKKYTLCYSGYHNTEENPNGDITSYLYDGRGRSIATIDPLGNRTDYNYDGHDRTTSIVSPARETSLFDHDKNNNTTVITDPILLDTVTTYDGQNRPETLTDKRDNITTVNNYNAQHQPLLVTAPLNRQTNTTYTATGEVDTVTDAENNITDYDYNPLGQLWKVHINSHLKVTYTYNAYGDVETETDALGRMTNRTYNKRRQLRTTTLPAVPGEPAAVIETTYDDEGMPRANIDARLNTTNHTYSPTGNPLTTTLPAIPVPGGSTLNNVLTTTYNTRDLPDTAYNSLTHTTTFIHDGASRLTEIHDPLTRITRTGYDANSRPDSQTNGLNHETTSDYTPRGELWNTWDALTKNTLQTYDANGNPWQRRNRRGHTHTTIYDAANRLHTSSTPLSHTTTTTYYDNDLVHTITEPSTQLTTLTYDTRTRLRTKTDAVGAITYGYTNADELWTVTEGAATITRIYDERGRLKIFTTADGDIIQYRYDANNNLARITYPPDTAHPTGKQVNYTYNARNLLETVTDWSNRLTTYQYDRLGRLTGTLRPNGTSNLIAHDAANQLTSIKESAGGKLINYLAFRYDDASQIKSRLRAPLVNSGWQQPTLTATYDDDNRLLTANGSSVVHDDDGNMTSGPITATSGTLTLGYNSRNQLTSAAGTTYTYDAEGRRRSFTNAAGMTRDVIDPSGKLLIRINPDLTKTYYVYGLGLLYEANEADATKTYHFDQVGSTLVRTNDSGSIIGKAEYSAYGLPTVIEGDMTTPFLYNGQSGVQTDSNGLLNMRARYYSPYLMRFLNADPIGFSGGSNWFAYADGNPISLSDPFGLCADRNSCTGGTGRGSPYASDQARKLGMATEVALGFTPVGVLMDIGSMGQAGYNGDIGGFGMAAVGFLPFGDFAKLGKVARYEDEMVDVYRGVHGGHPDLPNAYNGQANPRGGHSDPARHNDFDNESIFTSWTTDRNVAADHATQWGTTEGVILQQTVPRSSLTPSPDRLMESEVLRGGPVTGATPTILKR